MAKDKERSIARNYYVDLGKTAKEIALLTGVSEQTLSKWINDPKENWKEQRNAKISTTEVRTDNIRQLINGLCDDRMQLSEKLKAAEAKLPKALEPTAKAAINAEIGQIRQNLASIDDSVSKWNKTLYSVDKDGKVSFVDYTKVMDEIFMELRNHNEKLYLQTIDFQEQHLNKVASRYA
jgi:predicted transcriptional regulator